MRKRDYDHFGVDIYVPMATACFQKNDDGRRMVYEVAYVPTSQKRWFKVAAVADSMPFEIRGLSSLLLSSLREVAEVEIDIVASCVSCARQTAF
jgi:hypothetical protein